MPKDKSSRSSVPRDIRNHPYKSRGKRSDVDNAGDRALKKEWEDAICPICLEFPHNAVLLMCSSHDKGCRPYMCNTSYRHSNCLDQYRKAHGSSKKQESSRQVVLESNLPTSQSVLDSPSARHLEAENTPSTHSRLARRLSNSHVHVTDSSVVGGVSDSIVNLTFTNADSPVGTRRSRRNLLVSGSSNLDAAQAHDEVVLSGAVERLGEEAHATGLSSSEKGDAKDLLCPFCRGKVSGWQVVDTARKYLNGKSRSCSHESCVFMGTYEELRAHARCEHPSVRPSDVDPARQRDWRRLERQRDMGDVLSSIRSAMPGATVFGDYVIEDDDMEMENEDAELSGDEGHWWRVFFLFQIFGPVTRDGTSRLRSHHQRQQRRIGAARLRQLVENLHQNNGGEGDSSNDTAGEQVGEVPPRRQRNSRRHWGDVN